MSTVFLVPQRGIDLARGNSPGDSSMYLYIIGRRRKSAWEHRLAGTLKTRSLSTADCKLQDLAM